MRPHISLDVADVDRSVRFYRRVFQEAPQKQTQTYAKFDLARPALNFSLVATAGPASRVNHLGIEVDSSAELDQWERHLRERGLLDGIQRDTECCHARQDKLWFEDPDGNRWEVFRVLEQLPLPARDEARACCLPSCCA